MSAARRLCRYIRRIHIGYRRAAYMRAWTDFCAPDYASECSTRVLEIALEASEAFKSYKVFAKNRELESDSLQLTITSR